MQRFIEAKHTLNLGDNFRVEAPGTAIAAFRIAIAGFGIFWLCCFAAAAAGTFPPPKNGFFFDWNLCLISSKSCSQFMPSICAREVIGL